MYLLCTDNSVQTIFRFIKFAVLCKTWWRICTASHCLQLPHHLSAGKVVVCLHSATLHLGLIMYVAFLQQCVSFAILLNYLCRYLFHIVLMVFAGNSDPQRVGLLQSSRT